MIGEGAHLGLISEAACQGNWKMQLLLKYKNPEGVLRDFAIFI
jgi:hypothetical protein